MSTRSLGSQSGKLFQPGLPPVLSPAFLECALTVVAGFSGVASDVSPACSMPGSMGETDGSQTTRSDFFPNSIRWSCRTCACRPRIVPSACFRLSVST